MNKINAEWHLANRMPKNPTEKQRIDWHLAHAAHCSCREIPAGVLELMKKYGMPASKKSSVIKEKTGTNILPHIAAPALRALNSIGVQKLSDLKRHTEKELLALHGMGPKALNTLKAAMKEAGVNFQAK